MKRSFYSFLGAFAACLLLSAGCEDEEGLTALRLQIENEHLKLVKAEHFVVENYFDRFEFHSAMIMECTAKDSLPYPELTALLANMKVELDDMQGARAEAYNHSIQQVDKLRKEKVKVEEAELERMKSSFAEALVEMKEQERLFKSDLEQYDSLIHVNGIYFVSHEEYADSLLVRIMQWEDSLEEQGRSIATCRLHLNQLGWDKRSDQYRNAYAPVSELQANHKVLEAAITGAQNAQDRYASARASDGFFRGPFMNDRPDVDASEGLFLKLDSIMTSFRSYDRKFWNQFH